VSTFTHPNNTQLFSNNNTCRGNSIADGTKNLTISLVYTTHFATPESSCGQGEKYFRQEMSVIIQNNTHTKTKSTNESTHTHKYKLSSKYYILPPTIKRLSI
jgi:hypothetical protein